MRHLRLVESSRVDGGVRLQLVLAHISLQPLRSGASCGNEEALIALAQAITHLTVAERYIRDPNGVWG